jgi:hypothetical protein
MSHRRANCATVALFVFCEEVTMEFLKKFSWGQVLAALAALGIISTSEPEGAVISLAVVGIVALFGLVSKATKKPIGRAWLTITVYVVSFGLAMFSQPPTGSLPVWTGDPAMFTAQLAMVLAEFGVYALALTGAATVLYNTIFDKVVAEIEHRLPQG